MELPCRCEPLQRRHRPPRDLGHRDHARAHRLVVDEHGAAPQTPSPQPASRRSPELLRRTDSSVCSARRPCHARLRLDQPHGPGHSGRRAKKTSSRPAGRARRVPCPRRTPAEPARRKPPRASGSACRVGRQHFAVGHARPAEADQRQRPSVSSTSSRPRHAIHVCDPYDAARFHSRHASNPGSRVSTPVARRAEGHRGYHAAFLPSLAARQSPGQRYRSSSRGPPSPAAAMSRPVDPAHALCSGLGACDIERARAGSTPITSIPRPASSSANVPVHSRHRGRSELRAPRRWRRRRRDRCGRSPARRRSPPAVDARRCCRPCNVMMTGMS